MYSAWAVTLSCFGHYNRSSLLTYLLTSKPINTSRYMGTWEGRSVTDRCWRCSGKIINGSDISTSLPHRNELASIYGLQFGGFNPKRLSGYRTNEMAQHFNENLDRMFMNVDQPHCNVNFMPKIHEIRFPAASLEKLSTCYPLASDTANCLATSR